jgi:hypothetical protein
MALTVLAVAAAAVMVGRSSASHAESVGGPAVTQDSDAVGFLACNLRAIEILERQGQILNVSRAGRRVLDEDKPALVIVNPDGVWLYRSRSGVLLNSRRGDPSDHGYLDRTLREDSRIANAFKHQCKQTGKATRSG